MKQLFIFVDGLGLAPPADDNPVRPEVCPAICRLIAEHGVPLDACLGVGGLPQSATGQATLFCGRNAAAFMGRHVTGFPGPTLRAFVEESNVFTLLKAAGRRSRFADAYLADSPDELRARRFRSVTTTAALTVPETISLRADLLRNQALLHDITRESLSSKGYDGPLVTPKEAAEHLVQLALGYDYTLFEYFLTDQVGHSGSFDAACGILRTLDAFLGEVFPLAEAMGVSTALSSDHGNIEAISVKTHTLNPVPLIATGPGADALRASCASIADVNAAILRNLGVTP
ncbi:MAG: hypothetical protein IJP66_05915 [Kiritimatiellae bacterium]|nr:hypothetical protein [Kiritimatiellia bacterium]